MWARFRHWRARRRNPDQHRLFCACQLVAVVWVGRGPVQPGEPMGPGEVEMITYE